MSDLENEYCRGELFVSNEFTPKLQCKPVRRAGSNYLSFSIDAILGIESERSPNVGYDDDDAVSRQRRQYADEMQPLKGNRSANGVDRQRTDFNVFPAFDWMQCTRYRPPKVTRRRKKSSVNSSSRQPRIPFTPFQQATLEHEFQMNQYLTTQLLTHLSGILLLNKDRIKIWFQNRRARDRKEVHLRVSPAPSHSVEPSSAAGESPC